MAIVPAIPIVEAIGEAAMAAWRAYRAYQAAKALADAISQAQQQASDDAKPKDTTVPQAQTKSDAAASSDCKDCKEKNPQKCDQARKRIKKGLFGAKRPDAEGGLIPGTNVNGYSGHDKGLAQRLCEFINDINASPTSHLDSIKQAYNGVKGGLKDLQDPKFGCIQSPDLEAEAQKYLDQADKRFQIKSNTAPNSNFQSSCYALALAMQSKYPL